MAARALSAASALALVHPRRRMTTMLCRIGDGDSVGWKSYEGYRRKSDQRGEDCKVGRKGDHLGELGPDKSSGQGERRSMRRAGRKRR